MSTTPALQAPSAGSTFERTTIERRELRPHDVKVQIKYSGICHSDIHQAAGEWGANIFPMVPGHEMAGIVTEVGSEVTGFEVGDRAGVGVMEDCCRECEYCRQGLEQYCAKGHVVTYNGYDYDGNPTYGGYSGEFVVDERFAFHIPDALELQYAAPLLCAGITTYSPLKHWGAGPGRKVAIVGMGGLGHVAVQIAAAMGAEVTVLSHSLSKKEDGLRFGASDYRATSDKQTFKDLRESFDLILNTVGANLPMDRFLSLLRVDGTMVNVGLPEEPDTYSAFSLTLKRRALAGSNIGGCPETQEMLDFCAKHGVRPAIEVIPADPDEVKKAYARVVESDVRYRFVIDVSTLSGDGAGA